MKFSYSINEASNGGSKLKLLKGPKTLHCSCSMSKDANIGLLGLEFSWLVNKILLSLTLLYCLFALKSFFHLVLKR